MFGRDKKYNKDMSDTVNVGTDTRTIGEILDATEKEESSDKSMAEIVGNLRNIDLQKKEDYAGEQISDDSCETEEDTNELLKSLASERGDKCLGQDNSDYTMSVPFSTVVAVADMVSSSEYTNFKIDVSPVKYSLNNSRKDHVMFNNYDGIFDADFVKSTTIPDSTIHHVAHVSVSIPVSVDGNQIPLTENTYDGWYIITLSLCIVSDFISTVPVNDVDLDNMALSVADAVFKRSMNCEMAEVLFGKGKSLPKLIPDSIESYNRKSSSTTMVSQSSYSTADSRVDDIIAGKSNDRLYDIWIDDEAELKHRKEIILRKAKKLINKSREKNDVVTHRKTLLDPII